MDRESITRLVERPISIVSSIGIAIFLLLFLSPTGVFGDMTYLLVDFEEAGEELSPDWEIRVPISGDSASINNGYISLNITAPGTQGPHEIFFGTPAQKPLKYMNIETRLRCSSDNKLQSDIGGGARAWGFIIGGRGRSMLVFSTFSNDSDWGPAGFGALSMEANQILFYQPIQGVDIREWHNYTILWKPGNATFLIDGEMVATTPNVPSTGMTVTLWIETDLLIQKSWIKQEITFECEDHVCKDESIQIDHIRISMEEERFKEMETEITGLLSRALVQIEGLEQKGENTTKIRYDYVETQDNWEKYCYFHDEDRQLLENMVDAMEPWNEIITMFPEAEEAINSMEREGNTREALMAKGDYSRAETAWAKYEYDTTKNYLQKIIDKAAKIPETTLLYLGLFLLLALLQRRQA